MRKEAYERLEDLAHDRGADAVVGIREGITGTSQSDYMWVYGTAVMLE